LLNARGTQAGEAVLVDRILPGQELLDRERVAAARRITQRFVPGAGRSAMVSGLPSGPMTYLTLGRCGSVMENSRTMNSMTTLYG
jgi:hypothetical protein